MQGISLEERDAIRLTKKSSIFWDADEIKPTFRKNISPPSLESKNKASKNPALLATGFFLCLVIDLEDGSDMFPRNNGEFSTHHMALYLRR
jgi:hypothetical protein